MLLSELQNNFPAKTLNQTVGPMPIEFVNENLEAISKIVKENKLRRVYRGPRGHYKRQSNTYRCDAHSMVLYKIKLSLF